MLLVRFALQEHGGPQFCMEWETCLHAGIERLGAGEIDLVLLDLGLPDSVGSVGYLELHKAAPSAPVVVLTGSKCIELEFAVLSHGADDYLDKSLTSGSQLTRAIEGVLYEVRLRQQKNLQSIDGPVRLVSTTFWSM